MNSERQVAENEDRSFLSFVSDQLDDIRASEFYKDEYIDSWFSEREARRAEGMGKTNC